MKRKILRQSSIFFHTLYLFIQSFLLLEGTASDILSHLSGVLAGYVLRACSSNFCSSVVQGAGFVPVSLICCSAMAVVKILTMYLT